MRKKRRIFLVALLAVVLGGYGFFLLLHRAPPEPVYAGKKLSFWIEQFGNDVGLRPRTSSLDAEQAQATNAIRKIGANAFPLLLRWAGERDSAAMDNLMLKFAELSMRAHLRSLYRLFESEIQPGGHHHYLAWCAFRAFGADGEPAVPGLIHLLGDQDGQVRSAAIACLKGIGPLAKDAVPALIGCLRETNTMRRIFVVESLGSIHGKPELAVPSLVEVVRQSKGRDVLKGDDPLAPALSEMAIKALAQFGPAARAAVPVLLPALNDKEERIRSSATNALKQIDPDAAARAGVR